MDYIPECLNYLSPKKLYNQQVDRFKEKHETDFETPELEVERSNTLNVKADFENYMIQIDAPAEKIFRANMNHVINPASSKAGTGMVFGIEHALEHMHNQVLERKAQEYINELEEEYSTFSPNIRVDYIYFEDIGPNGFFWKESNTIEISYDFMKYIWLKTGETAQELNRIIRHEVSHALHYDQNREIYAMEWDEDIERAPKETITKFEDRRGKGTPENVVKEKVRSPIELPSFLEDEFEVVGDGENKLENDKYCLAHMTGEALMAAYLEKGHSEEISRSLTRNYLLFCPETPEEMREKVKESFNEMGLPYYPDRVRKIRKMFHVFEEGEGLDEFVNVYFRNLQEELENAENRDELMKVYYTAHAASNVYRRIKCGEELMEESKKLQQKIDEIESREFKAQ
ncbi:MAG: hypothetical protein SVV03_03375 [Candidatus Nanohaloarchaea archaeon]|nr:hypothetical protein [Candidatus Nanohaloarchaea archaeon]